MVRDQELQGNIQGHAVIAGFDAGRQLGCELGVIDIDVKIGEDGALGFHAIDPGKRGLDIGVGRMRPVA